MSIKKFKFISPGIFLNEIDNSQLPKTPMEIGPMIVGRTRKGPGMRPMLVESFSDFVETFGNPVDGTEGSDLWRRAGGSAVAPTYAAYAAQAWLGNQSPATVIRLLGRQHANAVAAGKAGWWTNVIGTTTSETTVGTANTDGGAYGLFLIKSSSTDVSSNGVNTAPSTGTLAAIFYVDQGFVGLSGSLRGIDSNAAVDAGSNNLTGTAALIRSVGADKEFIGIVKDSAIGAPATATITFTGDPGLNSTITITSTDGTVKTYTGKTSANAAGGTFDHNNGTATAASTLKDAIENAAGHEGKITVTIDGSALTLTQVVAGTAGNIAITTGGGLANTTIVGFANGAEDNKVVETVRFNFNRNSSKYIRKVFNTNPTLLNQDITNTSQQKRYFLGETFDRAVADTIGTDAAAGDVYGMILGLESLNGTSDSFANFRYDAQEAKTPWVKPQHLGDPATMNAINLPNLFRLCSHLGGQHDMHSTKVSITDIKASTSDLNPYGTFTLLVRAINDTDKRQVVLERFGNLNLNPASPDYIKRRIGDRYVSFDSTSRRNRVYGEYDNNSKYFRVEVDAEMDANGYDPSYLPFGFYTPPRPRGFAVLATGSHSDTGQGKNIFEYGTSVPGAVDANNHLNNIVRFVKGRGECAGAISTTSKSHTKLLINTGHGDDASLTGFRCFTGSFKIPTIALRAASSNGGFSKAYDPYWGFHTGRSATDLTFDESNLDVARPLPSGFNSLTFATTNFDTGSTSAAIEHRDFFTLDDLVGTGTSVSVNPAKGEHATWTSGSRASETSITAKSTGNNGGYKAVLRAGHNKFTMPVYGGFDGLNVKERDPFRNTLWEAGSTTMENNYAYNSVMEALDSVASAEDAEYNLLAAPGITNSSLTNRMMEIAENRGDSLAVIDIPNVYTPKAENKETFANRLGSVLSAVDSLNDRQVNNNYACTYYPWVQIRDVIRGSLVWAPPSVAALGAMAYSDSRSEPWFAPAGFSRGGLSNGNAGVPVVNVTEKLSSSDRDDLYDARINPIASFPAEGIVIFGQKTLQIGQSALDRINVRRLMILIKKQISRMASRVLFDQNVQVTWNRFLSMVEPFLRSVKTRLGLTDFKVVLDDTTTTPDLIDRNIMYAKIFLKPARSIEYIAIDFNITRSGASFED